MESMGLEISEAARAACAGRSYLMAQTMLAELFRRRVFTPAETVVPGPLSVLAAADTARGEPSIVL